MKTILIMSLVFLATNSLQISTSLCESLLVLMKFAVFSFELLPLRPRENAFKKYVIFLFMPGQSITQIQYYQCQILRSGN